jgi:ribosomal protein S27AE
VQSSETVANFVDDEDAIPDNLVADEHVAEVGDQTVMRAGVECPKCGSEVFLHPSSVVPRNSVDCFNCSYSPLNVVWWETPQLDTFAMDDDNSCTGNTATDQGEK